MSVASKLTKKFGANLSESLGGLNQSQFLMTEVDDPARVPEISSAIDALFNVGGTCGPTSQHGGSSVRAGFCRYDRPTLGSLIPESQKTGIFSKAQFAVTSGKGVYMRSLARDLARAVGTVGHIAALRRLRVGPFAEAMAISLDKAVPPDDNAPAPGPLLAVETALADIPALALTEAEASPLKDGQAISLIPLLGRIPAAANPDGGLVRAVAGGRAVALGRLQDGMLHPVRLLVPGAQAPSP